MSKSQHNFLTGIGGFALLSIIVGVILRLTGYPNQLLFYIPGLILFIVIFIPVKTIKEYRLIKGNTKRFALILTALFSIGLLVLAPVLVMQSSPVIVLLFALFSVFMVANIFFVKRQKLIRFDLLLTLAIVCSLLNSPIKPQAPNKLFDPNIKNPTYPNSDGPIVYLDEAHNNFHKLDELYWGFGEVLRQDGYQTAPFRQEFNSETLEGKKIIAIANALNKKNETRWINPTYSAFTPDEQIALEQWVKDGRSLFLNADHMPTSGAASELANKFGIQFVNGFAMDTLHLDDWFVRKNQTLANNVITNGFRANESVDSILTFTGQAFRIPETANPILTFGNDYLQWEPDTAWNFNNVTPYSIEGYAQGIYMNYGKGKVVAFGEAMMFTSQLGWGLSWIKLGLSDPIARNNQQLLLNIIHWLDQDYEKASNRY